MVYIKCLIEDCDGNSHYKAHGLRGWCRAHYKRWRKYGNPTAGFPKRGEVMDYLLTALESKETVECISWPYATNGKEGRAVVKFEGRMRIASRLMCIFKHGQPPTEKHEAAHTCNNGHLGCINPNHLVWKTPKENSADKIIARTLIDVERHDQAKLNKRQGK